MCTTAFTKWSETDRPITQTYWRFRFHLQIILWHGIYDCVACPSRTFTSKALISRLQWMLIYMLHSALLPSIPLQGRSCERPNTNACGQASSVLALSVEIYVPKTDFCKATCISNIFGLHMMPQQLTETFICSFAHHSSQFWEVPSNSAWHRQHSNCGRTDWSRKLRSNRSSFSCNRRDLTWLAVKCQHHLIASIGAGKREQL